MKEDLQLWIMAVQRNIVPVLQDTIIVKGNNIYCLMYGIAISTGLLGQA